MTIFTSGLLVICVLSNGQSYSDGRSVSRSRFNIKRASEYSDALGYAYKSESAISVFRRRRRDRCHPFAVVFDGDRQFVINPLYDDERFGCLRVFDYIVQALLNDSVEIDFGFGAEQFIERSYFSSEGDFG